jgi:putative N6-adenine-specific DNA methylase
VKLVAKTFAGCEGILQEELQTLGATAIRPLVRAVEFEGDNELLYKANLRCRTALRILKTYRSFEAANEEQLYRGIQQTDWSEFMSLENTFAINTTLHQSDLTHSQYVSQKAKDAIVDQFRSRTGKRPDVDISYPDLRIHLHISRNLCTISFDSSGDSLHKRGYRDHTNEAPLSEAMAAALVLMSGWDRKTPLADFMCGSGTILIEAAMILRNIAPGKHRRFFGFQTWKDYDPALWKRIYEDAVREESPATGIMVHGSDISGAVIEKARENVRNAGLEDTIGLVKSPMEQFEAPGPAGTIVTNPPYGLRIEPRDILELYKKMGDTMKQRCKGWTCWIFTGNLDAAKHIGLRPSRKIHLFNGPVECRFLRFDIYEGSKKGPGGASRGN